MPRISFFHFFAVENQGEKVLILRKSFDECIVNAVKIRERKVSFLGFHTFTQKDIHSITFIMQPSSRKKLYKNDSQLLSAF